MSLEPSLMGFKPLTALLMIALGLITILTASVPADENGKIIWKHVSGSVLLGTLMIGVGVYLAVTSV